MSSSSLTSRAVKIKIENPFVQPPSSPVARTYNVEVAKVEMLGVVGEVEAWLDQVEGVCSVAEFAEAAWVDLACTSMEAIPKGCWTANEQLVLETAARDHVRPWDRFKEWCRLHLDQQGLARYQLSVLKQTSSVAAYKADFDKLVKKADLPVEKAVACWISGLQADLQALNRGVVECYDSHDICLELFQTVAAALEVAKPLLEQARLSLSLLLVAAAKDRRPITVAELKARDRLEARV
ncbi:hypothetical protein ABBQ38_005882 [Trebouxia sp. C0009 RCD-2024]